MTGKKIFQAVIVLMLLLGAPIAAFADGELFIDVKTTVNCDKVDFDIDLPEGYAPYMIRLEFGDTVVFVAAGLAAGPFHVTNTYPSQGEYEWKLIVADDDSVLGEAEGVVTIDGPTVTLGSTPDPPLLTIESGEASIVFSAAASGGAGDYTYTWDLNGDGKPDADLTENSAAITYTEGGKYKAAVTAKDSCELTDTATLTVVVVDPEDDPENACHPTALKIAEAVSSIFPEGRAEKTYTCEDIFNIFEGALLGNHVGFGRLWHAYQLTQTIDDLTWEEIRDWKLDGSSWGALTQLNRYAETLVDDYGIRDLFDLVVNGDNTVGEIRTAARAAVRYEADFKDALLRISEGANPGELGQFYKLAQELKMEPGELDAYLDNDISLSELRHSASMVERTGGTLDDILFAKSLDHSWGEIGQAYKLADDETSAADILAIGVQEFRADQRELDRTQRDDERAQREAERNDRTAERYAEQYDGFSAEDVLAILNGEDCEGSWGCVRKKLREEQQSQTSSDRDMRTAEQIASKYDGISADMVMMKFVELDHDWNLVRAHYRDLNKNVPKNNKDK